MCVKNTKKRNFNHGQTRETMNTNWLQIQIQAFKPFMCDLTMVRHNKKLSQVSTSELRIIDFKQFLLLSSSLSFPSISGLNFLPFPHHPSSYASLLPSPFFHLPLSPSPATLHINPFHSLPLPFSPLKSSFKLFP